jgi:hypothetical protein
MPRFNQNLNEFGVTPSYKHEELPGGWCAAYGSIQILKEIRKNTDCCTIVKGCHTFNTPAPLLQELGLNNKLHTRTAVLWETTHTDSRIMGKPYSQSWKLLSIHIQQYQICTYHPKGWSDHQAVFMYTKNHYWMSPRMMNNNNWSFGYCLAKLVYSRKCPPAPRMCSLCMNYCIIENRNNLEASSQYEPICGILTCFPIPP